MATLSIKQDIARILRSYNQMFFGKVDHPIMGGASFFDPSAAEAQIFTGSPDVMKRLFGDQFVPQGPGAQSAPKPFVTIAFANSIAVHALTQGSTSYISIPFTQWGNLAERVMTATSPVVDFNVMNLMSNNEEKALLNALYALHDLMGDEKWQSFKANSELENPSEILLRTGEIVNGKNKNAALQFNSTTPEASVLAPVFGANWQATLVKLANDERFIPFALRRVAYLCIRMFSFYVAMSMLDKIPAESSADLERAAQLISAIYTILDNDLTIMKNDTLVRVTNGVSKRITRYNNYTTEINSLTDEYSETKGFVKRNAERFDTERKYEMRGKVLGAIALVIMIIAVVVATVAALLDMDFKQKLMVSGGALAFIAVAGIVLMAFFTKQVVEGFNVFGNGTSDISLKNAVISGFNTAILDIARDYLHTTMALVQSISSYRSFGNATYTMAKEYRYFKDNNVQLKNTGEKYRALHRASDLYQKKYGASMYLFIMLGLIGTLTSMAYIAAQEKMPVAMPVALGVGGLLAFIVLVVFILEVTGIVRTDGDKKYWGNPQKPL